MIGKTRTLRRTELLLRVYYNKQERERFGSSEYFRLQSLIDPLRTSYLLEAGIPYVHASEHSVRIEPPKRDGRLRI